MCLQEAVAVAVSSSNVGVERIKVDFVLLSGGGGHASHDKGGFRGEQAAKHGGDGSSHHGEYFITTALLAFPFIPTVECVNS